MGIAGSLGIFFTFPLMTLYAWFIEHLRPRATSLMVSTSLNMLLMSCLQWRTHKLCPGGNIPATVLEKKEVTPFSPYAIFLA